MVKFIVFSVLLNAGEILTTPPEDTKIETRRRRGGKGDNKRRRGGNGLR